MREEKVVGGGGVPRVEVTLMCRHCLKVKVHHLVAPFKFVPSEMKCWMEACAGCSFNVCSVTYST